MNLSSYTGIILTEKMMYGTITFGLVSIIMQLFILFDKYRKHV
jgi:hypothetical protein